MQNFNALSNIQLGKDYVLFSINPEIYPLNIVKKAALQMVKKACIVLDGDPSREILVEIRKLTVSKPKNEELKLLAEEFNKLLLQDANSN